MRRALLATALCAGLAAAALVGLAAQGLRSPLDPLAPAVLIEVAFITNANEERRLRDPVFKDRLAQSIHDSIARYHQRYMKQRRR